MSRGFEVMPRAYTERGPKRILNARIQAADVTHYAGSTAFGDRRLQFRKNESERKVETCVHRICTRPPLVRDPSAPAIRLVLSLNKLGVAGRTATVPVRAGSNVGSGDGHA